MRAVYLDSLNLINPGSGFRVEPGIAGLEAPAISLSSFERAGEDGISVTTGFLRERRITINGLIFADTDADQRQRRQALESLVIPVRDTNNLLVSRTLRIIDDDGSDYSIPVQVAGYTAPRVYSRMVQYQLDLLAENTAIFATTSQTASLDPATAGSFSLSVTLPFSFSGGASGQATVHNYGNLNSFPTVTLNGPLTNPTIQNLDTDQVMSLALTISAGSSLVIDMANKTMVLDGTTNEISTMSASSEWWWIQPGINTIQLTSGVDGEAGTATVEWQDAYVGI